MPDRLAGSGKPIDREAVEAEAYERAAKVVEECEQANREHGFEANEDFVHLAAAIRSLGPR